MNRDYDTQKNCKPKRPRPETFALDDPPEEIDPEVMAHWIERWANPQREKHHRVSVDLAIKYGPTVAAAIFNLYEACASATERGAKTRRRYFRNRRWFQRWTAEKVVEDCPYIALRRATAILKKMSTGRHSLFVRRGGGLRVGSDRAYYYALRELPDKDESLSCHAFLLADAVKHDVSTALALARARHWWRSNHAKFVETGDGQHISKEGFVEFRFNVSDLLKHQPYQRRRTVYRMLEVFATDSDLVLRREEINSRRIIFAIRPASLKSPEYKPNRDKEESQQDFMETNEATLPGPKPSSQSLPQALSLSCAKTANGMTNDPMECQMIQWNHSQEPDQEHHPEGVALLKEHSLKPPVASLPPASNLKERSSKIKPVPSAPRFESSSTLSLKEKQAREKWGSGLLWFAVFHS